MGINQDVFWTDHGKRSTLEAKREETILRKKRKSSDSRHSAREPNGFAL
jgi:hypothetical protein